MCSTGSGCHVTIKCIHGQSTINFHPSTDSQNPVEKSIPASGLDELL